MFPTTADAGADADENEKEAGCGQSQDAFKRVDYPDGILGLNLNDSVLAHVAYFEYSLGCACMHSPRFDYTEKRFISGP